MMVGKEMGEEYPFDADVTPATEIFRVEDLRPKGARAPMSFSLRQGELLGHRRPRRLRPHRNHARHLRRRPQAVRPHLPAQPRAPHRHARQDAVRARHQPAHRGPQAPGPDPRHALLRQHHAHRPGPGLRIRPAAEARRNHRRHRAGRRACHQDARPSTSGCAISPAATSRRSSSPSGSSASPRC